MLGGGFGGGGGGGWTIVVFITISLLFDGRFSCLRPGDLLLPLSILLLPLGRLVCCCCCCCVNPGDLLRLWLLMYPGELLRLCVLTDVFLLLLLLLLLLLFNSSPRLLFAKEFRFCSDCLISNRAACTERKVVKGATIK